MVLFVNCKHFSKIVKYKMFKKIRNIWEICDMKKRKIKLQTKVFLMTFTIVILIGICIGITGYITILHMGSQDIGQKSLSIAQATAVGIDGDKITKIKLVVPICI